MNTAINFPLYSHKVNSRELWSCGSTEKLAGNLKTPPNLCRLLVSCTLILFLVPLFSSAQNTFSTSQFLSAALNDQRILLHERQLDFLKNTDYELPWAKKLEFRTETDEMNLNRQEYLMRFRYHTKAERKAQRDLHSSDIRSEELEKTELLEEALMDHYFLLLKYITLDREINIAKQQQLVAADKLYVLRKKAAALADVDINDLLNAENRTHELEQELFGLEGEFNQLKKAIAAVFNYTVNIQFDTSDFIKINDLKETLPLLPQNPIASPALSKRQFDVEKKQLELEKEKAQNNWQLDYVQFKHAGRDKLTYTREWSFGMGMEIPLKDANKLTENEFMLERIKLENRLTFQESSLAERLQKAHEELDLKIKLYELATQQLSESQLRYSLETYPSYSDADPLVLLNIKSNALKRKANQLGIEKDIYRLYLGILELSGKSVEMPLRNYLTKDWELIE